MCQFYVESLLNLDNQKSLIELCNIFFLSKPWKSVTLSLKFASVLSAGVSLLFNLLSLFPVKTTAFFRIKLFLLCHQEILLGGVLSVEQHSYKFQLLYLLVKFLHHLVNVLYQFLLTNKQRNYSPLQHQHQHFYLLIF